MTTNEFIKMLQEADPTGNSHIRMEGGIPWFAEAKEGYWDGSYSYLDENGNWIKSTKDYKIDIHCMDMETFIEREYDHFDPNCTLEYIKSKFKFDMGNLSSEDFRIANTNKEIEKIFNRLKEFHEKAFNESLQKALQRKEEGWKFYQSKRVDNDPFCTYYGWKLITPNNIEHSSSISDTEGILHSNLFEKLDNNKLEGYYEWVKKN